MEQHMRQFPAMREKEPVYPIDFLYGGGRDDSDNLFGDVDAPLLVGTSYITFVLAHF